MTAQQVLDNINSKIVTALGTVGYNLTFGDPNLAAQFESPDVLLWGQSYAPLTTFLDGLLGVHNDVVTDTGPLSVWSALSYQGLSLVVVLEHEGA